jgi:hypothetical protein
MLLHLRWIHRPVASAVATTRPSSRLPAVRVMGRQNETEEQKAERKQAKKDQKEARRLQRQGLGSPDLGQKPCTLCGRQRDLLIRYCCGPWVIVAMLKCSCLLSCSPCTVDTCRSMHLFPQMYTPVPGVYLLANATASPQEPSPKQYRTKRC